MKKCYLSIVLLMLISNVYAQPNLLPADGSVGIGTNNPSKKLEVNGDIFNRGILYQDTHSGQGSGAHGISWYRPDYTTWFTYMAPAGASNAPNGTAAPGDIPSGVTTWSLRSNIENQPNYGWIFESGYNGVGHVPTVKFAINSRSGTFHSIGNGIIDGNIGIGDANPLFALDIAKAGNNASIRLKRTDLAPSSWYLHSGRLGNGEFSIGDDTQYRMVFLPSGNVGIGTTAPAEKLSVNGKIRAHEIKVETANWPDYVFTQSYQLPTLQETEKHIKEKGHLPGIPSAADVKANGIDVGEMNARLLQKIEELTLYLIEQNKAILAQKEMLKSQQEQINKLTIK